MWTLLSSKQAKGRDSHQINYLASDGDASEIVVTMRPLANSPAGALKAVGPYSVAVRIGDFLFASGQIPLDRANGVIVAGGIEPQPERVLENIKLVLPEQRLPF